MKEPAIDLEKIESVLKYVPLLEKNDPADLWTHFSELHAALYRQGWILTDFNWSDWHREAEELYRSPEKLSVADLSTIRKLLTYHCRSDHFCEGHLDQMLRKGHISAILRRLQEIREIMAHVLPFDRSYWVVPGKLMAGFFPGSKDPKQEFSNMEALIASGIRTVINLMEEDEKDHSGKRFKPYESTLKQIAAEVDGEVSCIRIPIQDVSVPSRKTMEHILDSIDDSMAAGRPAYVHCWGGRGRTGTVVGCYLVRHGLSGEEALKRIKELRRLEPTSYKPSPETSAQRDMVRTWREADKESQMVARLKPGDRVMLLSGKHKGKAGTIQGFDGKHEIMRVVLQGEQEILPEGLEEVRTKPGRISRLERFIGCLVGLAAGDAVGTAVEFQSPGTFKPVQDMIGGGVFKLREGEWTDDTSMALCLASSLIETKAFNPTDQLHRFVRWYREGYMSSNGKCFDIGNTTASALHKFEKTGDPCSGSKESYAAGNGSIMRLAPVPLFFSKNPALAIERSGESSRTTHGAKACVDACRYLAGLIVGIIQGESKETILTELYCPVEGLWKEEPLHPEIEVVARGSFKCKNPPEIAGKGYVVKTLEAALWAFTRTSTFKDGCLKVVNLGDDADTTGAVYGQLAGAYYGINGIPRKWREKIALYELIESMAKELYELSRYEKEGDSS